MAKGLILVDSNARQTARKTNHDTTFQSKISDYLSPNQTNQTHQASGNSGATKQSINQSKNSNIAVSDHQIPAIRHANTSPQTQYTAKKTQQLIHLTQTKPKSRMILIISRQGLIYLC